MMVRGDFDRPIVRSKIVEGVSPGFFFQTVREIPMVVAKTNEQPAVRANRILLLEWWSLSRLRSVPSATAIRFEDPDSGRSAQQDDECGWRGHDYQEMNQIHDQSYPHDSIEENEAIGQA